MKANSKSLSNAFFCQEQPKCDFMFLIFLIHDQRRSRDASSGTADQVEKHDEQKSEVPEFCIDAGSAGNIARFINHSCEPNLFVQCVLSSHQDIKLARVVLFAADNIPPLQVIHFSLVMHSSLGSYRLN